MKKTLFILATFVALTGMTAAQPADTPTVNGEEINPGVFGPDSFLYPAQVAVDNVLNSEEENVVKRAVEANQMLEQGNSPAAERALQEMEEASEQVSSENSEELQTAEQVISSAPYNENAQQGIDRALEAINNAEQRQPEDIKKGAVAGITDSVKGVAGEVTGVKDSSEDKEVETCVMPNDCAGEDNQDSGSDSGPSFDTPGN